MYGCLFLWSAIALLIALHSQTLNLLSHLTSVLEQMDPSWTQAFLQRTRLSDADFQGDVLAVISA